MLKGIKKKSYNPVSPAKKGVILNPNLSTTTTFPKVALVERLIDYAPKDLLNDVAAILNSLLQISIMGCSGGKYVLICPLSIPQ